MKPEDVPSELVDAASPVCEREGIPWHDDAVRMILAAALPTHERQVREQVATEHSGPLSRITAVIEEYEQFPWDLPVPVSVLRKAMDGRR